MKLMQKLATAGAVAAMGLGLGAASASAISIDGISGNPFDYTGTANNDHSFTVAEFFTVNCPSSQTTFSGRATGSDSTNFTPSYGGGALVCEFFGLPASVDQVGQWTIRATSVSGGVATGDITIPAGSTTTIDVPLAGCKVTVSGAQTFTGAGTAINTSTGVNLSASVSGISYSAVGCPFASGSDGQYDTNGTVTIPGIVVNP